MRTGEFFKLEKMLYEWFLEGRKKNIPIDGTILKNKAKYFYKKIYKKDDFSASSGWLQKFKKRHGIRFIKICGEKLSSQKELVDPFLIKLAEKIKQLNLAPDQIYNADETGLYWKLIPDKTYVSNKEKNAPGRKVCKQRLTFLACTNASGDHKIRPLVIGKSKNPRCLKNKHIPVDYDSSKSAWMTCSIFKTWFDTKFIPQVRCYLEQKGLRKTALLLLDNAPSHPPEDELISDDGQIITMFMPPNVTALIQPMDQNCIRITKLKYRNLLLSHIIANKAEDLEFILKKFNLRNAVTNLSKVWESLEPVMIAKCWKKIFSTSFDNEYDSEDEIPLINLKSQMFSDQEMNITKSLFQKICPNANLSSKDIYTWNEDVNLDDETPAVEIESDDTDVSEEVVEVQTKMSHSDGIKAINDCLKYTLENRATNEEISVLKNIRERAVLEQSKQTFKECKITDFSNECVKTRTLSNKCKKLFKFLTYVFRFFVNF
ncbi:jerky protein homolog-like [Condylostylus longicornis]|uniref:jerky protein homolog-like n=1 Tax=Condylostylus longicornis TaxID=2530218 RepID=UPI00244DB3EF|nr:jerky protein homolog-like [Condylostylus longicornis]